MASLWIREYSHTKRIEGRGVAEMADEELRLTDQTPLSFSATAAASAAFNDGTSYIAITSDADFHYLVATNPTATTTHMRIKADTLLYLGVKSGHKISVRQTA
jgi:hypothetical protein